MAKISDDEYFLCLGYMTVNFFMKPTCSYRYSTFIIRTIITSYDILLQSNFIYR